MTASVSKLEREDAVYLVKEHTDIKNMLPGAMIGDCLNTLKAQIDKKVIVFFSW